MASESKMPADASAEKAYASAAESIGLGELAATEQREAAADVTAVAFPAKSKRGRKPVAVEPASAVPAVAAEPAPTPKPGTKRVKVAKAVRRAAKKAVPAPRKGPPKIKPKNTPAPTRIAPRAAVKPASSVPFNFQLKDSVMAIGSNFTEGFKDMFADAQDKAKETFSKTTAAFGEYNEFAKGNVEAIVESGKILAAGLQDLGTNFVAESRSAFETATADVKELASVKSPADLLKLQSELLRKNFDSIVAQGSKNTEAFLKLASEVVAPISGRVSLAVEKVRQAA